MRSIVVVCAVVAAFVAGLQVHSHAAPSTEPGMMPYTPTRIEWLALDLEASYHQDFNHDTDCSLHYISKPPNTVLIFVHYTSQTSPETVDNAIAAAKQVVKADAASHNWSWVRIEVQRKFIKK